MERVPGSRRGLRHRPSGGAPRIGQAPGTDLHAHHQGRAGPPRREHHLRRGGPDRRSGPCAERLRDLSDHALQRRGAAYAATRGIIIADTKFEFGSTATGRLICDRRSAHPGFVAVLAVPSYAPGGSQPSFDKQFVRDYLLALRWDKTPPAPRLPAEVIATTSNKYVEALGLLTGQRSTSRPLKHMDYGPSLQTTFPLLPPHTLLSQRYPPPDKVTVRKYSCISLKNSLYWSNPLFPSLLENTMLTMSTCPLRKHPRKHQRRIFRAEQRVLDHLLEQGGGEGDGIARQPKCSGGTSSKCFPNARDALLGEKYRLAMETRTFQSFETAYRDERFEAWYDIRIYPSETASRSSSRTSPSRSASSGRRRCWWRSRGAINGAPLPGRTVPHRRRSASPPLFEIPATVRLHLPLRSPRERAPAGGPALLDIDFRPAGADPPAGHAGLTVLCRRAAFTREPSSSTGRCARARPPAALPGDRRPAAPGTLDRRCR